MSKTQIWILVLWIILTLVTCYTTYAIAIDNKKILDTINIFLLMLGGYGVVFSIIHNSESIRSNNQELKEKMEYDKIENTFMLLQDWDNPHLFKARKFTRTIGDERSDISDTDLISRITSDPKLRQSVILVFNYFENVRFSIKHKRVDIHMLKSSLGTTIIDIINRFQPYAVTLSEEHRSDMEELKELLS